MYKITISKKMKAIPIFLVSLLMSFALDAQTTEMFISANPSSRGRINVDNQTNLRDLDENYTVGTQLSLTAVPGEGSEFVNWTDGYNQLVSTEASFVYTVPGDGYVELYANFRQAVTRYTVSAVVTPDVAGSVSGTGRVAENDEARLLITHNDPVHYHFDGWSWANTPGLEFSDNPYLAFNITKDTIAYAYYSYVPQNLTITVAANNSEYGSVSASSYTVSGDPTSGTSISAGERKTLTLTATPNNGYVFIGWMKEGENIYCSNDNPYSYDIPDFSENMGYIAYFAGSTQSFTVQATRNDPEGGTVSPATATSISANQTATFTATPSNYWDFTGWYENGVLFSTDNPFNYTHIARDLTLEARFVHRPWTVTASAEPTQGGSVSVSGTPGTNNQYNHHTDVSLTANANPGYRFTGWSNNLGSNPTVTIYSIDRNYEGVVANFIETYTFSAVAEDNGSVAISTNAIAHDGRYDKNSGFTVTATPGENYVFDYWTVNGQRSNETSNTLNVSLTENTEVRAFFAAKYHVTLVCNPTNVATLSGDGYYTDGDQVTVNYSNVQDGYTFNGWLLNTIKVSEANPYQFNASANVTLVADFNQIASNYTVTVLTEGEGTIEGTNITLPSTTGGSVEVPATTYVTLTPTAGTDYHFVKWVINNSTESTNIPYSFEVNSNITIKAVFSPNTQVNVTVVKHPAGNFGQVTPCDGGTCQYVAGEPITFRAEALDPNYQFWGWIMNGELVGAMGDPTLSFTPLNEDVTIHAWFYAPTIEGTEDYLIYNDDSTIVTGIENAYRTRVTSINVNHVNIAGQGVNTIAAGALAGCTSLESIFLPPTLTTIGTNAFNGCVALASVDIPTTVTTIGEAAFSGCAALQEATLPEHLTAIPDELFSGCASLNNVIIPDEVTSIGSMAFNGCSNLFQILIPANVETVGNQAFNGCTSLRRVDIEAGIQSFGEDCFRGCTAIGRTSFIGDFADYFAIEFDNAYANPAARSRNLFLGNDEDPIVDLVIPDGVTGVNAFAFFHNTQLETLTIPASVTHIDSNAFYGVTNLSRIILGNPENINVHVDAFSRINKSDVIVEVPCAYYENHAEWNGFTHLVGPGMPVLKVVQRPGGYITVTNPDCGNAPYTYRVSAQATSNYVFRSWSDGVLSPTRDITLTEDMTLSAIFDRTSSGAPIIERFFSFETTADAAAWFSVSEGDNEWIVGDAANYYSTKGLYVTKDGVNANYNLGNSPYAYTELNMMAGTWRVNFNYNLNDVVGHDLTLALLPIAPDEDDDAYANLTPTGDNLPMLINITEGTGDYWSAKERVAIVPNDGWYRLVAFYNVNSDENPADFSVALDNISLRRMNDIEAANINVTVLVNSADPTMGSVYTWIGDETQDHWGRDVTQERVKNTVYNTYFSNDEIWIHAVPTVIEPTTQNPNPTRYRFVSWNDGNTDQDRRLDFLSIFGEVQYFTAYFEEVPENWVVTVTLDGEDENHVPASGEYGIKYKVTTATDADQNQYDIYDVRLMASYDDDDASEAVVLVNLPLAGWAFTGWSEEGSDLIISTANPFTVRYADFRRDVNLVAHMTKLTPCSYDNDYDFYIANFNGRGGATFPDIDNNTTIDNVEFRIENGAIVVDNTGEFDVTLYDVNGRALETRNGNGSPIVFDVPISGSYLVRVGNLVTRRIVVIR